MRPHDDIAHPDPEEVLHHIRESQQRWQAAAERLARQRDHYIDELERLEAENYALRRAAQAYRDLVEATTSYRWDPAGRTYLERRGALDALLNPPDPEEQPNPDIALPGEWCEPDGDSQVPVPRG